MFRSNRRKEHCICKETEYCYVDFLTGQIKCLYCQKSVKTPKLKNITPIPNITY